ncbi:cytochrome d ubiquinol oxidase subunit II [Gephyromycinifex aptenodytis]|uniref:cytochrome d ubiquinol oxidase subunit II n=1 Tax=Gephyromycinifex aptenodytis TaxID=2716227 RepID=UPI00144510F3|nr:cytochrome d ubiquinol oxidase subunit II [Gephyromycinifex aptenodytis]
MDLAVLWFILIAVLWIGYFCLEGFDFGVGMLLPVLGKSRLDGAAGVADTERRKRVMLTAIGPHWDGNEVWLLTAGGATFAAFREWYATLFDGFYLALLLILVALIVRVLGFEYRGKGETAAWRSGWDKMIVFGSFIPALLWGVAFGNIVRGTPLRIRENELGQGVEFAGSFFSLLNPFALVGGLTTLFLFLTHGAIFLALKTDGDIRHDARALATKLGAVAALFAVVFLVWTNLLRGNTGSWILSGVAAVTLLAALAANHVGREGWAFVGTFITILAAVAALFTALFPDVMPSTADPNATLTIAKDHGFYAANSALTLKIMTGAALVFTPIVVAYQGWTYWMFRKRLTTKHIPGVSSAPERVEA